MRTTVTLDPDVEALIRATMKRRSATFKEILNEAVRTGLSQKPVVRSKKIRLPTFKMGFHPDARIDKALALAASIEDEEVARKMSVRK